LKISRLEQQMTKPGKNAKVVKRQIDRLVEIFDAFTAPARRFTAIRLGMFSENQLCLALRCGTTVAL
jgi:hypothetical protein